MKNFLENFTLIKSQPISHVAYNTTAEFEAEIIDYFSPNIVTEQTGFLAKIYKHLINKYPHLISWKKTDDMYFCVLMGHNAIMPKASFLLQNSAKKVIYLFDAWQAYEKKIIQLIKIFNINVVFFSSKDACDYYKKQLPQVACHWIAEGITTKPFQEKSSINKDIDVLQLGRNHHEFNDKIIQFCKDRKKTYFYQKTPKQLIFGPESDALHTGFARTKISICVPQAVTHPEKTGPFSTMTRRYLESMASKCLILGVLPDDMKQLFEYNPIIETDSNNIAEKLDMIFRNFETFRPLIERNYTEVFNNHQWRNRCQTIAKIMNSIQYQMTT